MATWTYNSYRPSSPSDVTSEDGHVSSGPSVVKLDTRIRQNATDHHTERFHCTENGTFVIRRGQKFLLNVTFNQPYDVEQDEIRFIFETGSSPVPGKGTSVTCAVSNSDPYRRHWGAWITNIIGNDVTLAVVTSSECIVGEWRISIVGISRKSEQEVFKYQHNETTYILFNPWCPEDVVYMEESLLSEYVLNDSGAIFVGNHKQIGAKPWNFAQFEEGVLEACLFCLGKAFSFRSSSAGGSAVRVVRAVSKIVNNNDDDGVIIGNWRGDYAGGKSPLSWTGSADILRQYMRTRAPVKWGQCFVFSGVVTTICRAIGIPCRSVTNFSSAHDTDANLTVDFYWDATDGRETPLDRLNADSVWNFHVWNDVWMRRDDLPPGYDGWQAVDATPQETSDGRYQCGPGPLQAIRKGQCTLQFDCPFIFAEVNADKVNWTKSQTGEWTVLDIEKSAVGQKISTKIPDGRPVSASLSDCELIRQDITEQYKLEEESERERIAVLNASRAVTSSHTVYRKEEQDVHASLLPRGDVMIGHDFDMTLAMENTCLDLRTVEGTITCEAITYTGSVLQTVKILRFTSQLQGRAADTAVLNIKADDYLMILNEAAAMTVSIIIRIPETGQIRAWQEDFRLRKPDLKVQVLTSHVKMGIQFQCKVTFQNPLQRPLSGCLIHVEGPGLDAPGVFRVGLVYPNQCWSGILELTPQKFGLKQVIVSLESDLLTDVNGVAAVCVLK